MAGGEEDDPLGAWWVVRRKYGRWWRRVLALEGLGDPFYRRVEDSRSGWRSPELIWSPGWVLAGGLGDGAFKRPVVLVRSFRVDELVPA